MKFCSLFCIFFTCPSEVDFGIAYVHTAVCVAGCWSVLAGKQVGVTLLNEKCAVGEILSMCVCLCCYQHSQPVINVFVKSMCAVLYCSSLSIMLMQSRD